MFKRIALKFWAVSFLLVCSVAVLAEPVGTVDGAFSVTETGGASYSIPIEVPAGPLGISPSLAINYDSNASNSAAGMGGNIVGLSSINRCPSLPIVDGYLRGVQNDFQDQFCLDGQRLILISGQHGEVGAVYSTEIDSGAEVTIKDSISGTPQWFEVKMPSGNVKRYGWFNPSRVVQKNIATAWLLSRFRDPNGNTIDYHYREHTNQNNTPFFSEVLPRWISYGQRTTSIDAPLITGPLRVSFDWEARPDVRKSWSGGIGSQSTKRLAAVRTGIFYKDSPSILTPILSFKLGYEQTPLNNVSRMTEVTKCNARDLCYRPTTFKWRNLGNQWNTTKRTPPALLHGANGLARAVNVDVNNDGWTDWVQSFRASTGNEVISTWLNGPDGYVASSQWKAPAILFDHQLKGASPASFADVNGDGLPDLIEAATYKNNRVSRVLINTGNGWQEDRDWQFPETLLHNTSENSVESRAHLVDLNGDSLIDVVTSFRTHLGDNRRAAWLNTGKGWVSSQEYLPPFVHAEYFSSRSRSLGAYVDINADGLVDWVAATKRNSTAEVRDTWINTGNGWALTPRWKLKTPLISYEGSVAGKVISELVDLNGDGLLDQVMAVDDTSNFRAAFINNGRRLVRDDSYQPPVAMRINNKEFSHSLATFMDLNLDGLPEIVVSYKSLQGVERNVTYKNTGLGWERDNDLIVPKPIFTLRAGQDSKVDAYLLDLNSDGRSDFVWSKNNNNKIVWLNNATDEGRFKADAIFRITNAVGYENRIHYTSLSDETVYTKSPIKEYPIRAVNGSDTVVASVATSDGVGGLVTSKHHYGEAYIDATGRGFLGFRWQEVSDIRTGVVIHTEKSQNWPLTGQTISMRKLVDENGHERLIQDSKTQYDIIESNNGLTVIPVETGSIQRTFSLDGNTESPVTTSVSTTYNDKGDLLTTTKTTSDGTVTEEIRTENKYLEAFGGIGALLRKASTIHSMTNLPAESTTTMISHDERGNVTRVASNPDSPHTTVTTHEYDAWGNKIKTAVTARNHLGEWESRTSSMTMTSDGRFTASMTNPKGHVTTIVTNARFGKTKEIYEADGTVIRKKYNAFGNLISDSVKRKNPLLGAAQDTIEKRQVLRSVWCDETHQCPDTAKYFSAILGNEKNSPETLYLDMLGREVRKATFDFNGKAIYVDTTYDAFGRKAKVSNVYRKGTVLTDNDFTHFEYDQWGRASKTTTPTDGIPAAVSYRYDGKSATTIAPNGGTLEKLYDYRGNVVRTVDALGNVTKFTYDLKNRLTKTIDPAGQVTTTSYNLVGKKIDSNDPVLGHWRYQYDGFGSMISQTDARNYKINIEYDILGRMVKRTEPEVDEKNGQIVGERTIKWLFDSENGAQDGKLAKVRMTNAAGARTYLRNHNYDEYGRLAGTTTLIDDQRFVIANQYEGATDRLIAVTYPNGKIVRQLFNDFGYPVSIHTGAEDLYKEYADYYDESQRLSAAALQYQTDNMEEYEGLSEEIQKHEDLARPFLDQAKKHQDAALKYKGYYDSKMREYNAIMDYSNNREWFKWFAEKVLKPATPFLKQMDELDKKLKAHEKKKPARPNIGGNADDDRDSHPEWIAYEAALKTWLAARTKIYNQMIAVAKKLEPYEGHLDNGKDRFERIAKKIEPIVKTMQSNAAIVQRENKLLEAQINKAQPHLDKAEPLLKRAKQISNKLENLNKRAENANTSAKESLDNYKAGAEGIWKATNMTADGKVRIAEYGAKIKVRREFAAGTGHPNAMRAWRVGSANDHQILNQFYRFDQIGNLMERTDDVLQLNQSFDYDVLNRLTFANTTDTFSAQTGLDLGSEMYMYDELGNIVSKSGVGSYNYDDSRSRYMLSSITTNSGTKNFSYDATGNQTKSAGRNLYYNAHQKPVLITRGGDRQQLTYDPGQNLIKDVSIANGKKQTTYRLGDYEKVVSEDNVVDRITVKAAGTTVAVLTESTKDGNKVDYLMTDYLGSVVAVVNASGAVMHRYHYDAFGRVRQAFAPGEQDNVITRVTTDKGFGGHINMANVGLVHMGGRVYDAEIGRFLSADPNIQFPFFSQGLNRYSYVLNNPLSLSDPTGYFLSGLKKFLFKYLRKISAALKHVTNWIRRHLNEIVMIAVGFLLGPGAAALNGSAQAAVSPFVAKAIGSTISYVMNGGSFKDYLKSFVVSQAVARLPFASGKVVGILDAPLRAALTAKILGGSFSKAFKNYYTTMVATIAAQSIIKGISAKLDPNISGEKSPESARSLYLVKRTETSHHGSIQTTITKVNTITTAKLYVNGILGDTVDRVAYLGARHTNTDVGEFTIFYNPSGGFLKDMVQSLQGKLTGSTIESQELSQGLLTAGDNLQIYAHSQGGIITANALNMISNCSIRDFGNWEVNWHSAAIRKSQAKSVSATLGIKFTDDNWRVSAFDAVPQLAGMNALSNPLYGALSLLAVPSLFMGERYSFHTLPAGTPIMGIESN